MKKPIYPTNPKYWRFFGLYGYYNRQYFSVFKKARNRVRGFIIHTNLYGCPFSVREGYTWSYRFLNWIIYKYDR